MATRFFAFHALHSLAICPINNINNINKSIIPIAILALPMIAHGAGCEDYPYSDGINAEDVAGGTNIDTGGEFSWAVHAAP